MSISNVRSWWRRGIQLRCSTLLLTVRDVERNPGPAQPCYACSGAITTKGLECVKCARCHMKCSGLTRNEAVQCQRLDFFLCNHCDSRAGDLERCSVYRKGFRLHQYRAISNICSSPCHLACTQLPRNDRDMLNGWG